MLKFARVLAASVLLPASALASTNTWLMCDDCSPAQMEYCAIQAATMDNLRTGDYAWIVDFAGETVSKYYILVTPAGGIIQGGESDSSTHLQSGSVVTLIEETVSSDDAEIWDIVIEIVRDIYRPQGWGYNYPSCGQGVFSEVRSGEVHGLQSQPLMSYPVNIPSGPDRDSAYDIIGRNSHALQLGQSYSGILGHMSVTQTFFTNWWRDSPIDSTTSLVFVFSDGSSGIWRFNFERNRWEADWSTFEDSDGNPIPHQSGDVQPGNSWWFSGTEQGEENLANFLARLGLFGIPVSGPDGHCSPAPIRCDVTPEGMECVFSRC